MFQEDKFKGKDALKFVKNFECALEHQDKTTIKQREDMFPIGLILAEYGQKVQDFPSVEKALAAARHLCKLNRQEHGYEEKPEFIDKEFPQFSKLWFVFTSGRETENAQVVSKKLHQNAPVKTTSQLEQAKVFMEGMGFDEEVGSGGDASASIEHARNAELQQAIEGAR